MFFLRNESFAPISLYEQKEPSMAYFYWIAILCFAVLLSVTLETIATKNEDAQ